VAASIRTIDDHDEAASGGEWLPGRQQRGQPFQPLGSKSVMVVTAEALTPVSTAPFAVPVSG
jgi:hypothetical protein